MLKDHVNAYFKFHGVYPKVVAADKIYHNERNKKFCEEHRIKMTLGMMPAELIDDDHPNKSIRNAIEGKFGEARRRYNLTRIMAKLAPFIPSSNSREEPIWKMIDHYRNQNVIPPCKRVMSIYWNIAFDFDSIVWVCGITMKFLSLSTNLFYLIDVLLNNDTMEILT